MTSGLKRLAGLFARRKGECEELRELASLYLESEASDDISDELRQQLQSHLDACDNCESFVSSLRETIQILQNLPKQELPTELRRILLQIGKKPDSSSSQG